MLYNADFGEREFLVEFTNNLISGNTLCTIHETKTVKNRKGEEVEVLTYMASGTSHCNKEDKFSYLEGQKRALTRALSKEVMYLFIPASGDKDFDKVFWKYVKSIFWDGLLSKEGIAGSFDLEEFEEVGESDPAATDKASYPIKQDIVI